jgi:hypothetical protein
MLTDQDHSSDHAEMQKRLEGENINIDSFLATDYLNHFNEVFMMLEMVPDMPDMLEEVVDWQPKTYEQHFKDSSLHSEDLIIEAFNLSPDEYRKPFDKIVARLDEVLLSLIRSSNTLLQAGDHEQMAHRIRLKMPIIGRLITVIGGIINGDSNALGQEGIDEILSDDHFENAQPTASTKAAPAENTMSNDDLDDLFG